MGRSECKGVCNRRSAAAECLLDSWDKKYDCLPYLYHTERPNVALANVPSRSDWLQDWLDDLLGNGKDVFYGRKLGNILRNRAKMGGFIWKDMVEEFGAQTRVLQMLPTREEIL